MNVQRRRQPSGRRTLALAVLLVLASALAAGPGLAQPPASAPDEQGLVSLDFENAELSDIINTIAQLTHKNFIYDDRVRGRVTIVSPTRVSVDQAYAVFESVLQVKGFTTVMSPGGSIKIIPVREAKESSIETVHSERPPPNRDQYVTRLIPLSYVDAEAIVNTLKPLVSKDAAMAAYGPTNTVILTESASNIRRILAILESIDVENFQNEIAVIRIEYADATTLAEQISEIYGAEITGTAAAPSATRRSSRRTTPTRTQATTSTPGDPTSRVRIITDERTNSLIVLASRTSLEDVRELVYKLDVPVTGGGRIHVYYLRNADAEELATTLQALISGQPAARGGGAQAAAPGQAQVLRAAVSALAEGITITADPATNSLVIQASQEGFSALRAVIEKLDIARPQVLVEALIMEVKVTDGQSLGFSGVVKLVNGDTTWQVESLTEAAAAGAMTGATGVSPGTAAETLSKIGGPFAALFRQEIQNKDGSSAVIETLLTAAANTDGINIISAPHILTSDNEQAEIRIGDNIPIISSRVQSAAGQQDNLATSVNVERQDIGVTLRVTPQITEGNSLRLEIFEELTAVNEDLQDSVGNQNDVGVALLSRRIENTVVVADGETVVIGGLISDTYSEGVSKVPWLGDVPVLGWLFKTTSRTLRKTNLLLFLTPHIVRAPIDLEKESIRKREEFFDRGGKAMQLSENERREIQRQRQLAQVQGRPYTPPPGRNPVRTQLLEHQARYPLERMREIEEQQAEERAQQSERVVRPTNYYVQAAVFGDENAARDLLTELVDAGWDGALVSSDTGGGVVLYEVRLGPFTTEVDARRVSDVVARSHGLAPSVLVGDAE